MSEQYLEIVLERLRQCVLAGDSLAVEFAIWFDVHHDDGSNEAVMSGLWSSRDVALAGLREASGRVNERPFRAGLRILRGREFFTPYSQGTFEADPLAILSVALGIRHAGDGDASRWIADIASRAIEGEVDPWRIGLLRAACVAAGVTESALLLPAELAVALSSKGIVSIDKDTATRAYSNSLVLDEPSAERAIVRLAALKALTIAAATANTALPLTSPSYPTESSAMDKVKILFVSANPLRNSHLALDEEQRDIQGRILKLDIEIRLRWLLRLQRVQMILNWLYSSTNRSLFTLADTDLAWMGLSSKVTLEHRSN